MNRSGAGFDVASQCRDRVTHAAKITRSRVATRAACAAPTHLLRCPRGTQLHNDTADAVAARGLIGSKRHLEVTQVFAEGQRERKGIPWVRDPSGLRAG